MPQRAVFLVTALVAMAARAEAPTDLALPIDCEPGTNCWVLYYVDHDPGPGVQDYTCGQLTREAHKGTDIAIRDLRAMIEGVEVRAAAAGVVDALRDGMPDVSVEETGREAVASKECGNGIRIAHGDGWTTWYCHLRRGSLMVAQGDRVEVGQPLALVGLSGDTSFPHLHFEVRQGEQPIDPFIGLQRGEQCSPGPEPLWRADVMAKLAYQPVVLTTSGIAPTPPEPEDVRRGYHNRETLPVTSRVLELWVEGFWVEAGDRARFRLVGPGGASLLDEIVVIDRARQRWFQFVGAKRPGDRWPAGTYTGEVTLVRDGIEPITIRRTVELR
jgi:hypothetical protein